MKIVVDTSDFISALIGKTHREKLKILLANPAIEIFADENLLKEISDVAQRDKFRKYVTLPEINLFLEVVRHRLTIIKPTIVITDSPDPDDNYLLALAVAAQARYLVTGDKKHLLALSPFRGIQIIRMQNLLDILTEATK